MTDHVDPMGARTISEKILSHRCGHAVRASDIVVCAVDCVLGTDGSAPMAIDYFEQLADPLSPSATRLGVFDPARIFFSLDHYAPPNTPETRAFHARIRRFAERHSVTVFDVGDGISHQVAIERGLIHPGDLIVGADSHTVTCGAVNCFAIGVGSSDLAAAMFTGQIWLRVPQTIRVILTGQLTERVAAKDVALALVAALGPDGANYCAIEFDGAGLASLSMDDRLVLSNLMVESGAKAAIFPCDAETSAFLAGRGIDRGAPVAADPGATYLRELTWDLSTTVPQVARPHTPDNVGPLADAAGTPVQMVFIGTCTGGRVRDFHDALEAFQRAGGSLAAGVQLVLTPASREVHDALVADGTLDTFVRAGAIVTETGCGACCGTSGVIPGDGTTVLSTANRNFKARMGNGTAAIYLASPAACGAAAAIGAIPERP
jgi:3-isopropylmalate/(R)-2-methylmalate dehydratase large subunit